MVKTLLTLVVSNLVTLLELAGVAVLCVGLDQWLGRPAVFLAVGVALLVKSVELDIGRKP